MSITVKLGELVNGVESRAFTRLAALDDLTGKSVFDAHKLLKRAQTEYEAFTQARNALVKQHGEETEDGQMVVKVGSDKSNIPAFTKEFSALLDSEVTLECSKPVVPARIFEDDKKPCGLKPADISILEPFAEFPGDAAEKAKDADAEKPEKGADA